MAVAGRRVVNYREVDTIEAPREENRYEAHRLDPCRCGCHLAVRHGQSGPIATTAKAACSTSFTITAVGVRCAVASTGQSTPRLFISPPNRRRHRLLRKGGSIDNRVLTIALGTLKFYRQPAEACLRSTSR